MGGGDGEGSGGLVAAAPAEAGAAAEVEAAAVAEAADGGARLRLCWRHEPSPSSLLSDTRRSRLEMILCDARLSRCHVTPSRQQWVMRGQWVALRWEGFGEDVFGRAHWLAAALAQPEAEAAKAAVETAVEAAVAAAVAEAEVRGEVTAELTYLYS